MLYFLQHKLHYNGQSTFFVFELIFLLKDVLSSKYFVVSNCLVGKSQGTTNIVDLPLLLPCVSAIWTSWTWLCWFDIRLKQISGNDWADPTIVAYILKVVKSDIKIAISILLPSLNPSYTLYVPCFNRYLKLNWSHPQKFIVRARSSFV